MREFMKRHYWTPGWLIIGAILLAIAVYSTDTGAWWDFVVGIWVGLWAAYPIIREQHERGRKAGWAAGYEAARQEKA